MLRTQFGGNPGGSLANHCQFLQHGTTDEFGVTKMGAARQPACFVGGPRKSLTDYLSRPLYASLYLSIVSPVTY